MSVANRAWSADARPKVCGTATNALTNIADLIRAFDSAVHQGGEPAGVERTLERIDELVDKAKALNR